MGILNKVFGQKQTITVHFIDIHSGQTIGVSEMTPDQLPQTFETATNLTLQNEEWTVQEAIPPHSIDFIAAKKLTLKLAKVQLVNPQDLLFSLPTISNELPQTVSQTQFHDFELIIREDDWRQNEFFYPASFPLIDIEIEKIRAIWNEHSKMVSEDFTAFDQLHVRDTIGEANLQIDIQQLQGVLGTNQIGHLRLEGHAGFIKDGFSLQTEATSYYGIVRDEVVSQFCISRFSEKSILEVQAFMKTFHLLFVSWYHAELMTSDDE